MLRLGSTLSALIALTACGATTVADEEALPPTAIGWLETGVLSTNATVRRRSIDSYGKHWAQLRESAAEMFRRDDPAARHAAAYLLARFGGSHDAPLLRIGLRDASPAVRVAAAGGLARIGDTNSASHLIDIACTDATLDERLAMLRAAATLAPKATERICQRLAKGRDWRGRRAAAQVLGSFTDERSRDRLRTLLDDSVWMVSADAALALAERGDRASRSHLREMLTSKHAGARITAVRGLHALGGVADLAAVRSLAERETDPNVRRVAKALQATPTREVP